MRKTILKKNIGIFLVFTFFNLIGINSSLLAQVVPCNQRVIDNASFSYMGSGATPARWSINQADTGNAHLDQTAFSYVANGNFSNQNVNPAGGTYNSIRQYAVVTNPNTLSPQYANIPTDGMLVINPLQDQSDQYITYSLGGLVPGNTYNIEIKVWNVLDLPSTTGCCGGNYSNWNDQLYIDMQNNQAGAEHSNQSGQNWTGTNGGGTWSQGTNQVNNILKISSGGSYAIITGSMTMPASGNTLTITLAKGGDAYPVVLGIDYIKVYGCQQEAINISGGTPNVCEASQFTLTAQGIGPVDSSYQWYHNGVLLPGRTSDTLNIVSGIVAGAQDIYKAVGQWDAISDTLISKLCCSSVGGTSDEVYRQSFNGLTYTCGPPANAYGPYADIPPGTSINSAYNYAGTTCNNLNDGQYAVVQNSYAGQYWKNRPEVFDHTGVAGSGALFVNATGGIGQNFFSSTLTNLCNSTTYEFSIWYASLAATGEIKPIIQFDVLQNGAQIPGATTSTGTIPINEQWYEADVTFTTPATGTPTYTLQALNEVSGSSGNDLMLDDIVVKKCTPSINLYENGTSDSVVSVCNNNPVTITVNTFYNLPLEITGSATGTIYYQWMSATSATGPWTLIGTPDTTGTFSAIPTATTTYYRAKVSANKDSAASGIVPQATACGNDAMTNSFTLTKGGNFGIPPITGTTNYCIGATMTLTGDPGTGSQWEWRKGNTAMTATPIIGYTYSNNVANKVYTKTFAITDTGNYYFYAKTAAGCESYSIVNVIANPLPTIAVAATSASVCLSTIAQTSNLTYTGTTSSPTKYGITWDALGQSAGLATVANTTALPASPISITVPANTPSGTYTGTITVSNVGGCTSTGTTFILKVNPIPTITPAATAASVCISSSIQTSTLAYTATTGSPTKYTITWDPTGITAGLVNVVSTNLPTSPISINVPANTQAGTYTGTIIVTNAEGCASAGTTFTLTVNPKLSAIINCGTATNNSVQFNWSKIGTETGYTISHTINNGSSISDGSITTTTFSVSSLNPGDSVTITVTPTGGSGCFSPTVSYCKATICPTLTPQTPTTDQAICNNGTETFTENGSAGLEFTWTNSNTAIGLGGSNSTGTNPLTITFTSTNTGSSDITGRIRIFGTIGICTYAVDSFNITVHPDAIITLTSAATTNPQTVCINQAITNITFSITGTGNNATVSGLPNGVTGAYNAGVFTISGTPTQSGVYNYTVTATGTCGNGTATGTITVTSLPVISSITPANPSSCGGSDGSFTINGLAASTSYIVNFIKDGTVQTAQSITSNNLGNLVVGSLKQGNYTGITVTTTGGCVSTAGTTALSDPSVFNPVASSNSPCVGSTLNLVSTTSADPTATYFWTGPNGYTANIATPSIPNTTIAMNGDYTVKATVSGCSSSSTVTVKINSAPSVPTGTGAAICGSGTVTLGVTPSGSATDVLTWYSDAGLTTQVATGTSFTTPSINLTTNYYVTETNMSGCISSVATIIATINPIPSIPTTTTIQPSCTSASGSITVTVPASGVTYSFDNGNTFQPASTDPNLLPNTYQVVVKTNAGGCLSPDTTVTINPQPVIPPTPMVSIVQPDCNTATGTITVTNALNGENYSFDNGNSFGANATSVSLVSGTYQVVVKNTTGGCINSTSATITPQPLVPATPAATITQPTCTVATGTINVTSPASGVKYSFDNGANFQSNAISGNLTAGNYQVIVQGIVGGCLSSVTPETINPRPIVPDPPTVRSPVNYCENDTTAIPLIATTILGNTLNWYDATGAIGSVAPTPSTATGGSTTYSVTSFNGTCESPKASIVVNIDPISAYAGGPIVEINQGQTITLKGNANGNDITISWSPTTYLSDATIEDPELSSVLNDITYTMRVSSPDGCKAKDTVHVVLLKDLIIPNAFTPNGDGINDKWIITYLDEYATATVSIFNRYGQMIFQSSGTNYGSRPWDGTYSGSPVPVGTYYYIIKLGDGKPPLSGSISVIR